jgi:hypothetical protein
LDCDRSHGGGRDGDGRDHGFLAKAAVLPERM